MTEIKEVLWAVVKVTARDEKVSRKLIDINISFGAACTLLAELNEKKNGDRENAVYYIFSYAQWEKRKIMKRHGIRVPWFSRITR